MACNNQEKWKYTAMPNMIYPPTVQQQPIGNQNHQNAIKPPPPMNHHPSQMQGMNHQSNHLGPNTMLNQSMNNNNTMNAHQPQHGMPMQSGPPMYDHMLQNPLNGNLKGASAAEFIYLNQQHPHHLNMAQNQYMASRSNITSSSTKKLWDNKSDLKNTGPLAPLQMPGSNEHQMWSKEHQGVWAKEQQMWSTQDSSSGMIPRRSETTMPGILSFQCSLHSFFYSPRDSTGGLGVKMVEYVLGGSPTNKESPLTLEPRLRGLKIDDKGNDDKENNSSPFETNGLKKDESNVTNGSNGIDDDKGFNRTPGSRQPSPAEEHLPRLHGLEQSINVNVSGFSQPMMQHMMNNHDQQQMGSSFHLQHQQHHQHPLSHHVLNNGMPVQNPMVNQGQNHIDSPANMLQQQASYEVSSVF
ncbi:CLUMA_CG011890, isoform A [Clunio marinus]|uniref:CLUMA_CG011890, isoform A n=1 Tax=Clunio marinus TaxID=568069 RepID=A0A1J1IEA3_9DIPT|nr:CLUMA_CG011890, isoform A [Clunio marinus]